MEDKLFLNLKRNNLLLNLKRVNFIFKHEELMTECIKNFKPVSFFGEPFGPFEKGHKYRLKFFKALPFIQNKILKLTSDEKCDNVDVQRYAISERDDQKLIHQQKPYFLNRIKEFKSIMEYEVQNNIKPKMDLDRYISYASNIIDSRLLKLLRLSKADLSLDDEQRLTSLEKILYRELYKIIKAWRDFLLLNS
ncbi:MAG: hypothetical protein ACFFEO_12240 [Candidatus Thorarchaeota archaeon]